MSIEKRDNLLGAWAVHCDGPDCHMEALSLSEADVLNVAKTDGWAIDGPKHECPDCVAGNSPAVAIKEDLPAAAGAQSQVTRKRRETVQEKFAPFDERSGDTIPGITASAEDIETPEDQATRQAREKRQRERQRASRKDSMEKTRAAMGGVDELLNDFEGMFGNSITTWDE